MNVEEPTREELHEMAKERDLRCPVYARGGTLCKLPAWHEGEHQGESREEAARRLAGSCD
jgi:hypothetical protein